MNNILKKCEELLLKIRQDKDISPNELKKVSNPPFVHPLRAMIGLNDKEWLLSYLKSGSAEKVIFALNMYRNLSYDEEIIRSHLDLWNKSSSFLIKNALLWNMLSFEKLENSYEKEIKAYIDNNFDKWLEIALKWLSDEDVKKDDEIITHYKNKINQYPERKAYLYLYCASILINDPNKLINFIESYKNLKNKIVQEVIESILDKINS